MIRFDNCITLAVNGIAKAEAYADDTTLIIMTTAMMIERARESDI